MDRDSLTLLLAQGVSVEEIGRRFDRHPSTVAYWMRKFGLEAPNRQKHAAKGGIQERLEALVEAGMTIRQIANELGVGPTTVRHWLKRHRLRTRNTRGPRHEGRAQQAREDGRVVVSFNCIHHGETDFVIEARGYYRCKRCRADSVARHRRRLKEQLVEEAGGSCRLCGYSRYLGALAFHHLDPAQKRLQISWNGVTQSLERLRAEASKCVLLCSNCHAEVEAGFASVPASLALSELRRASSDSGSSETIRGSSTGRANGC
jgi:transposase